MKNLIYPSLLIVGFCSCVYGQAQQKESQSYIYLHDGSVYVGKILSEDIFELRVKTASLDTITLNKAFIKKTVTGKDILLTTNGKYHKTGSYFFTADWMAGSNARGDGLGLFSLIAGKRLNQHTEAGLGLGITSAANSANDLWRDQGFLNMFVYGKRYLNDKTIRPFVDLKTGWSVRLSDGWFGDYSGGLFLNPGIGIQIANRKKMKWSFRLSQAIQQTSGTDNLGFTFGNTQNAQINYKHWLNRTSFGIGIHF